MKIEIDGVIYSKVTDFYDEILGDVAHFVYTKEGELKNQFFVIKRQGEELVYIMLEDKDNKNIEKKYFGGRV